MNAVLAVLVDTGQDRPPSNIIRYRPEKSARLNTKLLPPPQVHGMDPHHPIHPRVHYTVGSVAAAAAAVHG